MVRLVLAALVAVVLVASMGVPVLAEDVALTVKGTLAMNVSLVPRSMLKAAAAAASGDASSSSSVSAVDSWFRGTLRSSRLSVINENGTRRLFNVEEDGSFKLHDLEAGTYSVHVLSSMLLFAPVKLVVGVSPTGNMRIKARYVDEYASVGGAFAAVLKHPLAIEPYGVVDHFQQREGFNPMGMLMNPMMLMMLFFVGISFCLPKMMDGMDQETLQREMAGTREDGTPHNVEPIPSWGTLTPLSGGPQKPPPLRGE